MRGTLAGMRRVAMALVVLGVALPPTAAALETVHRSKVFSEGEQPVVKVPCPKGTHVVSGGAATTKVLTASRKVKNGWEVASLGASSGNTVKATAYAYCSKRDFKLAAVKESVPVEYDPGAGHDGEGTAEEDCPLGYEVVSGGASMTGGDTPELTSLMRSGTGWEATGQVYSGIGNSSTLDVFAYCTPLKPNIQWFEATANDAVAASAVCTSGTPISGGASGGLLATTKLVNNGWRARTYAPASALTAEVGCR